MYENLVFEGGGVRGVAYLGVLDVLEKKDMIKDLKRVAGTSAGSLFALLFALGLPYNEVTVLFEDLCDFVKIFDDSSFAVVNFMRFISTYGMTSGKYLRNALKTILERYTGKGDITFAQFHELAKDKPHFLGLYVTATNLNTSLPEIFSYRDTPNVPIYKAVCASMSCPIIFPPVKMNGALYVDGGLVKNYPIQIFDDIKFKSDTQTNEDFYAKGNLTTLGLRLDTIKEIRVYEQKAKPQSKRINSLETYFKNLAQVFLGINEAIHLHSKDFPRTVYIDTKHIRFDDADITDAHKKLLIKSGRKCLTEFLS